VNYFFVRRVALDVVEAARLRARVKARRQPEPSLLPLCLLIVALYFVALPLAIWVFK
jgi:hypothetical protein